MQRRQDWMREYLVDEGQEPLGFVASAKEGDEIGPLARRIREGLGLGQNWAEQHPTYDVALRRLRRAVEDVGILIFINGVVGNTTHRKLDPDEFQGFVLIDDIAPLVFVNGADYKSAQMFTIAHELAHVWVGTSTLFDFQATQPSNVAVEKYCNRVAAEFLVPAEKLRDAWPNAVEGDATFEILASRFKVSQIVVARRAKDCKLIRAEEFFAFYKRRREAEETNSARKAKGGNFWNTQNTRVGRRFGQAVVTAALDGRLSYTDAYDLVGLRGETFDTYTRRVLDGGGA
ncbi:MAG: ImmA/IrrE family metallo-endopeptidase [Planctomycetota bacterium]